MKGAKGITGVPSKIIYCSSRRPMRRLCGQLLNLLH